jgi:hypothetical protein
LHRKFWGGVSRFRPPTADRRPPTADRPNPSLRAPRLVAPKQIWLRRRKRSNPGAVNPAPDQIRSVIPAPVPAKAGVTPKGRGSGKTKLPHNNRHGPTCSGHPRLSPSRRSLPSGCAHARTRGRDQSSSLRLCASACRKPLSRKPAIPASPLEPPPPLRVSLRPAQQEAPCFSSVSKRRASPISPTSWVAAAPPPSSTPPAMSNAISAFCEGMA